jgi:ABC-2 type transport system ATP-binding protein
MTLAIRTEHLRKVYNSAPPVAASTGFAGAGFGRRPNAKSEIVALEDLTIDIAPGEIFGLLGPNGAGKSTTIGILTTRVKPTSGRAWIGSRDVWSDTASVKQTIGVVPQRPNLDFSLTCREILTFHAAYFGVPAAEREKRADQLLAEFQLVDRANQLPRGFSGGLMQRVSIARALMHDPSVLFLDEPSTGLDPQTRHLLWDLLRGYHARGKTIVVTTHNMEEADALCQHLAIVDHGRIIATGTPSELKKLVPGGYVLRLHFDGSTDTLRNEVRALSGVTEVETGGDNELRVYAARGGELVGPIVTLAAGKGRNLTDVRITEPSLENLFLHLTGRSLRE